MGIAGIWECLVTSSRGNISQQMEIVVLETSATYCPADRVNNNKGDFRWVTSQQLLTAARACGYTCQATYLNSLNKSQNVKMSVGGVARQMSDLRTYPGQLSFCEAKLTDCWLYSYICAYRHTVKGVFFCVGQWPST